MITELKRRFKSFDDHSPTREKIIEELGKISDKLAEEGHPKYFRV